jgi:predicted nucleotidyltransferase
LFAFGSVLTNRFNDKSDIDLVVDFENVPLEEYADNYFDLKDSLSSILHREIDLLEEQAIRNPILRKNIDSSKLIIFEP